MHTLAWKRSEYQEKSSESINLVIRLSMRSCKEFFPVHYPYHVNCLPQCLTVAKYNLALAARQPCLLKLHAYHTVNDFAGCSSSFVCKLDAIFIYLLALASPFFTWHGTFDTARVWKIRKNTMRYNKTRLVYCCYAFLPWKYTDVWINSLKKILPLSCFLADKSFHSNLIFIRLIISSRSYIFFPELHTTLLQGDAPCSSAALQAFLG